MSKRTIKVPEALRDAYKAARRAKWDIIRTRSSHLKWIPPEGEFVITPASPSGGHRSNANSLAALRKAGLTW